MDLWVKFERFIGNISLYSLVFVLVSNIYIQNFGRITKFSKVVNTKRLKFFKKCYIISFVKIVGSVENTVFRNAGNGYSVISLLYNNKKINVQDCDLNISKQNGGIV